ncbi:hypothetical protein OB955_08595 [Halobacteria archaeon AArc-m2/3/4]|uniref:DUF8097 domain-containing protein n=1 Tax=Natronoglomus mannanivorans TaxID=2979990 RepID=A0ABT2QCZ2_9EURY|nr:hypothetical protein [Halobacteria archaeon AArc-m2/3/4]
MTSRRRAVIEFFAAILALLLMVYGRTSLRRREEYDDPPAISAAGVAAGTLYQLAFHAARDRDCGQIRTNRYRVVAYGLSAGLVRRWLFSNDFHHSFNAGELGGTILYRLWYGVLHPVPVENERTGP